MKIALAADHAGFELKQELADWLIGLGHEVIDCGTSSKESCDYPDYVEQAAQALDKRQVNRAIFVCGTGQGSVMVANRFYGVRCALCLPGASDSETKKVVEMARRHNNANALALGARLTTFEQAKSIVEIFLNTSFDDEKNPEGRHFRRIIKFSRL